MVAISLSGSGEGLEGAIPRGYSTAAFLLRLVDIFSKVGRGPCTAVLHTQTNRRVRAIAR